MTDTNDTAQDEDTEVQNQSVDDLFNDKPEESDESKGEKVETKPEVKPEEEEEPAESPSAEEKSVKDVPVKALTEERRKRQEAEKRIEELEAKLSKAEPEAEKVPDPIEDPEGYAKFIENKSNMDSMRNRVNLSRDLMLDAYSDYEEKEKVFVEMTKDNPSLIQRMTASPNPAKFAYKTAVEHLETQKLRDPKYKENLEQEIRKKILAELEQQQKEGKKPVKKSALDLPDITKATAAGKNSDTTEPVSTLDDVMENSPF